MASLCAVPPPLFHLALAAVCITAAVLQRDIWREEKKKRGKEFHFPDTPNLKTNNKKKIEVAMEADASF